MHKNSGIAEQSSKRPQTTCLRRKIAKIVPLNEEVESESPLISTISLHPQVVQNKYMQEQSSKQTILKDTFEHQYQKMNRIYNKTDKKIQILDNTWRSKTSRASVNCLKSNKGNLGFEGILRPKSSNNKNILPNGQIFKINNEVPNYQNRPGSSKSSRLFKRRTSMQNDAINAENEEFESLLKVKSIAERTNSKQIKNRVGISLNHTMAFQKMPAKLDPTFYKLFAQ